MCVRTHVHNIYIWFIALHDFRYLLGSWNVPSKDKGGRENYSIHNLIFRMQAEFMKFFHYHDCLIAGEYVI